jgi:hypothetical protein
VDAELDIMSARVTIGVPVYRGERFLEETLRSIQNQTYADFQVIMSIDGPDATCEAICNQFLEDSRFKMFIQSERLGMVGNLNWLQSRVDTEFWYYHQQDDVTLPTYLEVLVDQIDRLPCAALVYCDIVPMGKVTDLFEPEPSVLGSNAFIRQMTMLHQHLVAFARRGLTRSAALKQAGPLPTNAVENFGVDMAWLAGIARWGELHRVPLGLYRKRYHDRNAELRWSRWPRKQRLEAWPHHCVDMLNQALHIEGSIPEMRLLWMAAVERLASASTARTFVDLSELSKEEYRTLLTSFLALAEAAKVHDIPHLLDADWRSIRAWTEAIYWIPGRSNVVTLQIIAAQDDPREAIPGESVVDIVDYGPNPIEAGRPFNPQRDGTSAIWLRTSKAILPGTRVRLGGEGLKTTLRGTLATAIVPNAITAGPAEIPLMLTARNGQPRSNVVTLQIIAAQDEKTSDRILELQKEVEERSAWALKLDEELAEKNGRILELQNEVEDRSAWALKLASESAAKDRRIEELKARAKRAETSRSWRITAPLRLVYSSALLAMARLKPAVQAKGDAVSQRMGGKAPKEQAAASPRATSKSDDSLK